jgi:2-polyprenyl-6-methoxyphenol hydroxylase-like FAD-dependent oxidoreductase
MTASDLADKDRVLIVGGGIGGALLALILGRQGVPVTVFDPRRVPAPTFRNEKLGEEQADILRTLGALEPFARVCLPPADDPRAYAVNPRLTDCGAHHHDWVAAVRADWPASVRFVEASVSDMETSDAVQIVVTSDGARHEGRLIVLASGRAAGLHKSLGIEVANLSAGHSVTLGFTLEGARHIHATVFQPRPQSHIGYVSVFPIASAAGARQTRVNIFSFKPLTDDWTRRMSRDPLTALAEVAPEAAAAMDGLTLKGRCELRGTDLYRVRRHQRPGLVLLGDAFHAPCPSSGTGLLRVLSDARALNALIPQWLATPGMGLAKISQYYRDPAKRWIDRTALRRSLNSRKSALMSASAQRFWNLLRALRQRLGMDAASKLARLERRMQAQPHAQIQTH